MTAKELGEQTAFPALGGLVCLTKRELFAAMAMQARLGNPWILQNMCDTRDVPPRQARFEIAVLSVTMADALLAELAKGQP